jgi:hypothetical protein
MILGMGAWSVDSTSEAGILRLTLAGRLSVAEMTSFVEAHNRAIDDYQGRDYKVFCDVSQLEALEPAIALLFEVAKRHSSAQPNFRGSSVYAASTTVGLQHRHTSIRGGVMNTELISDDLELLREHLRTVWRTKS